MVKKASTLETPFRKGEKVMTTCRLDSISEGTEGKVKLANGLGTWRRYWIRFSDGQVRGQVSHDNLVRPAQLDLWQQREADREQASLTKAAAASSEVAAVATGNGDAPSGLAALVPAHLLERSKAAKARLTGG